MSVCTIAGCENQLRPNSRTLTCATCRSNLHILGRLKPADIIVRDRKQTKYRARLDMIATVSSRGGVKFIDMNDLAEEKILCLPRKQVTRENVVPFSRRRTS